MPETQQVIIEFVPDTTRLDSGIEQLENLGKVDSEQAAIFRKTNQQLADRNNLIKQSITNTESLSVSVSEEQAVYNKLVNSLKNLSGSAKDAVKQMLGFSASRVSDVFKQVGVSVDDYISLLKDTATEQEVVTKGTVTLKTELLQLTNRLAELTAAGETETAEFEQIANRAGKLKNALSDTRQVVSNLGSDVPVLKVFAAAASGITGAFTAASGVTALFGDDNKDLQETLVKVNALMAINQGLSQALNVVRDEAAISTAKLIITQKIENAQLEINNALESESIVVRAAATVAQYALNAAIALSPVGIVTIAIAALVTGVVAYTSASRAAKQAQDDFNQALKDTDTLLNDNIDSIERLGKDQVANLDFIGAQQSQKLRAQAQTLVDIQKQRLDAINNLNALIFANENSHEEEIVKLVKEARDKKIQYEKDYANGKQELNQKNLEGEKQVQLESLEAVRNSLQARLDLSVKNTKENFATQRQLANAEAAIELVNAGQDAEKRFQINAALIRKLKDIQIAENAEAQKDINAANQSALIKSQNASRAINDRLSREEVEAQNKLIHDQAEFDIQQEGLTQKEKNAIILKANQEIIENNKKFRQQEAINALEDQKSLDQAILDDVNSSNNQKLDANIDSIFAQAAIEIEQNKGKVAKIKEIEAKRDKDVRDARIASIELELQQEIDLRSNLNAPGDRNLQRQLDQQQQLLNAENDQQRKALEQRLGIQQLSLAEQFKIIDLLTAHELEADKLTEQSLDNKLKNQLISEKEYQIAIAKLRNDESKIFEDAEKKKEDLVKQRLDAQKKKEQELVDLIAGFATTAVSIIGNLFQNQSDRENQDLDRRRKAIQDLEDQGAISAKEASDRNKQLDREQAQIQRRQAQRDKDIALFNAFISGTEAIIKAYTAGPFAGPVLAAITAAFVFAQIAAIASKPLPQFKEGKKNSYEGWGLWAESGSELFERDGKMYIGNSPTISYIKSTDKIYNPSETNKIMSSKIPTSKVPEDIGIGAQNIFHGNKIDYDKLGEAVGRNIPQFGLSIDRDGFNEYIKSVNSKTNYLNNRRWKR